MIWLLPGLLVGLAGGLAFGLRNAAAGKRRIAELTERTERAEASAKQSARLAEVGTLTGVLAHEIKNPLSTVGLNLQLLQEDLAATDGHNERFRNRLSTVQRETIRLREILDDFLRYAGKLELDRHPTDMGKLLEELADFFTPQAQLARVQIRLRSSPGIVCNVDQKTIKQAVLNLMLNAVQAMSATGGDLILSAQPAEDGFAVIDVIDTGPGIPPEVIDKIFQTYYSTKQGGSGLGLAMARRVAAEHGGSLSVRSEQGKGSDFSLRLPMETLAAPPLPNEASSMKVQANV
jgi:signal transduction histidine kinase